MNYECILSTFRVTLKVKNDSVSANIICYIYYMYFQTTLTYIVHISLIFM